MRVAVLSLALLPAASAAEYENWTGARFEKARVRRVEPAEIYPEGAPGFEASLAMTLVALDKSNWTEARVLRQARKSAQILAACEIELRDVRLARVRGPRGRDDVDLETMYEGSEMPADVVDWSARVPASNPWPVVFFVGRLLGDKAVARAYRRGAVEPEDLPRYPYMNTAWIAYRAHWTERRDARYSSLAHELAHILCECGHEEGDEPHLLEGHRNQLSSRILDKHCGRMRASSLLYRTKQP